MTTYKLQCFVCSCMIFSLGVCWFFSSLSESDSRRRNHVPSIGVTDHKNASYLRFCQPSPCTRSFVAHVHSHFIVNVRCASFASLHFCADVFSCPCPLTVMTFAVPGVHCQATNPIRIPFRTRTARRLPLLANACSRIGCGGYGCDKQWMVNMQINNTKNPIATQYTMPQHNQPPPYANN